MFVQRFSPAQNAMPRISPQRSQTPKFNGIAQNAESAIAADAKATERERVPYQEFPRQAVPGLGAMFITGLYALRSRFKKPNLN